jgi:hypothetical protein
MFANRQEAAVAVYQSFLNSGFSDAQARSLTAEINRENSLREDLIFGSHTDPANKVTNIGMLSWQGSRAPALMEFLSSRGQLDERGRMKRSLEALQAQTDFIRYEMETNPAYAKTKERFLGNPDINPQDAAVVLGDNYIRWRRTDPKYASSGQRAIREGYSLLGSVDADGVAYRPPSDVEQGDFEVLSQAPVSQATPEARRAQYGLGDRAPGTDAMVVEAVRSGDMTKAEALRYVSEDLLEGKIDPADDGPLEQDPEPTFLDRLGDAAQYLNLAGVGQPADPLPAPRMSNGIYPGRQGVGSKALSRFGIASLV